jgi:hypothetical protein
MKNEMRTDSDIRNERLSRWLNLRWPPGFLLPNCPCCPGTASQAYYAFGGEKAGSPNVIISSNFQWSGGWTTKTSMAVTKEQMGRATPTAPNPLYNFGGDSATTPFFLQRCDKYVPDTWTGDTSTNVAARFGLGSCAISGLCYSWGGKNSGGTRQNTNEQLTPGSPSTWATKATLTVALYWAAASYISGKGYNIGGNNSTPADVNTNYEYDPSGNSWATKTAIPSTARNAQACFTISGTIYNVWGGGLVINRNDSYVVDTWTAKSVPTNYANGRQYASHASIDASGVAWVTGGLKNTGALLNNHDEYVPDTWSGRTALSVSVEMSSASPA